MKRSMETNKPQPRWQIYIYIYSSEEVPHFICFGNIIYVFICSNRHHQIASILLTWNQNTVKLKWSVNLSLSCDVYVNYGARSINNDMEKTQTVLKFLYDEIAKGFWGWFAVKRYVDQAKLPLFPHSLTTPSYNDITIRTK